MTWIKLYREFLAWEWFGKPEMVQLFVWLLLNASVIDRKWEGKDIKRGQLITTLPAMCEATGLSRQKVRTCINRLKSTHEITCKSTNKFTTVTICNYERYQGEISSINTQNNLQNNLQTTYKQPTNADGCTDYCTVNNNLITVNKNGRNITTTSIARAREEEFITTLKSERAWLEVMAKNYGKEVSGIIALLDDFRLSNECRAIEHHNLSDARRHFNDWLQKQPKNNIKNKNNQINEIWR